MMMFSSIGAPNRNRTGTPAMNEATDFKSGVSTSFTTGAEGLLCLDNAVFLASVDLQIQHGQREQSYHRQVGRRPGHGA